MRIPSRGGSNFRKPQHGGVPVDVQGKKILRHRSGLLTNAQRHVLRQMGVRVDKNTTEKQAVMLVKRVCGPETNYKYNPEGSLLFRKRRKPKPKNTTSRQHRMNVLMHREEQGSKSATKDLAKL